MKLGAGPPANIIINNKPHNSNRLHVAIENHMLPSSPLDDIGFQSQMNKKQDPQNVTESLAQNDSRGLDAIVGLDRRFSMVSIESSATTGRLLDHLGLNEEEENWAKCNENAFKNTRSNISRERSIPGMESRNVTDSETSRNWMNNARTAGQQRGGENQGRTTKALHIDKRLPMTPQQQRRAQNYAPADKFPSLQRRFQRPKLSDAGGSQIPLESNFVVKNVEKVSPYAPYSNTSGSSTPVRESERTKFNRNPPVQSPNLKPSVLHPSPLSTPRKFAKDFSDQFEASPKRKESPVLEKRSAFSTPIRPTHGHSRSNPVNVAPHSMAATPKSSNTLQSDTPSPKERLQRTPSTPVSRGREGTLDKLIFTRPDEIAPEVRVALAIELKRKNQPQEASYQLQLAAEQGSKDAMLLYGLSLRYGYGLKKDERQSFLWLCRAADIDLVRTYKFEIDPFELANHNFPAKPEEPLASTLLEIGKAYMNGWGVDRDENYGIQFIEKSASLGFSEAMLEAGNTWSTKGPNRKKNLHRSASWYRLADKFGKKLVGNSWIYKAKYMERG